MVKATRYKRGESGNPRGRPKGAKDKRARYRELLEPHAQELIEKSVSMALDGDVAMLRLCMDRLIPTLRATDEYIHLSGLGGTRTEQSQVLLKTMANGDISPDQALSILRGIVAQGQIFESDDLEKRVRILEQ